MQLTATADRDRSGQLVSLDRFEDAANELASRPPQPQSRYTCTQCGSFFVEWILLRCTTCRGRLTA